MAPIKSSAIKKKTELTHFNSPGGVILSLPPHLFCKLEEDTWKGTEAVNLVSLPKSCVFFPKTSSP